jgi:hypothetical protein
MKRSTLGTAAIVMTIAAPLCGASAWADEAHHPAQAAPAQTPAAPSPAAPSASEHMQPGHAPSGMMMNCPMMQAGQTAEGGIGCPMMQGYSGMTPGQTQGMGSGMMRGQTQHPPVEQGQAQPGQMQPPASGNQ